MTSRYALHRKAEGSSLTVKQLCFVQTPAWGWRQLVIVYLNPQLFIILENVLLYIDFVAIL